MEGRAPSRPPDQRGISIRTPPARTEAGPPLEGRAPSRPGSGGANHLDRKKSTRVGRSPVWSVFRIGWRRGGKRRPYGQYSPEPRRRGEVRQFGHRRPLRSHGPSGPGGRLSQAQRPSKFRRRPNPTTPPVSRSSWVPGIKRRSYPVGAALGTSALPGLRRRKPSRPHARRRSTVYLGVGLFLRRKR